MKYQEVVDYLYNIPRFTKGGHMENVRMLLEAFDCPQDSFRYIHVAGTNGERFRLRLYGTVFKALSSTDRPFYISSSCQGE